MVRALIALSVIAGALALAWLARRFRSTYPTAPAYSVPAKLERWDFAHPDTEWLLAVFTSKTCSTCAAVARAAECLGDDALAVQEVEFRRHGELHRRYSVDAVPLAVLADRSGRVRASVAGPTTEAELSALVASARQRPASA